MKHVFVGFSFRLVICCPYCEYTNNFDFGILPHKELDLIKVVNGNQLNPTEGRCKSCDREFTIDRINLSLIKRLLGV